MTRSATPGEPETALDKAWSDLLDEMWAKATGPDFEEMLERHRPAIEAEARAESSAEVERREHVVRYDGRIEAFDAVLAYVLTINGNGYDEPREPALDAVYDKVRDLRSRATAARSRETPDDR